MKNLFPIFTAHPDLVYLDNAATTHKPQCVIDAISACYSTTYAPVYRGVYRMAEEITTQVEQVRSQAAHMLGAHAHEIIFTSGATNSINTVAQAWARTQLNPGDRIVITELEHHANITPWMQLAKEKKLELAWIPLTPDWSLDIQAIEDIISPNTKLVAHTLDSNIMGPLNPHLIHTIATRTRAVGAALLYDATQLIGHRPVAVTEYPCDFLVASAHKMYGPTGIGLLYINERRHAQIATAYTGGGTVETVTTTAITWRPVPHRLEPGTPAIAEIIGLGAALTWRNTLDWHALKKHEALLCAHLIDELNSLKLPVHVLGDPIGIRTAGHIVSFNITGYHPHDIAQYLDSFNICVRAGTHCAQPAHVRYGLLGSLRISMGIYNTLEEIDKLMYNIKKI